MAKPLIEMIQDSIDAANAATKKAEEIQEQQKETAAEVAEIKARQEVQDRVLAELLLSQQGGVQ